jgi:hypothetical protein
MKTRLFLAVLCGVVLGLQSRAADAPAAPAAQPAPQRELFVVVVDSLHREAQEFNNFNRIAYEFEQVFKARHWPVRVTFERFAANTEHHELELKVYYQGIINLLGGERQWKAWMVLTDHDTKHDFGIVEYTYLARPGEQMEDTLAHMFRGAGEKAADLIQPYVAPESARAKR